MIFAYLPDYRAVTYKYPDMPLQRQVILSYAQNHLMSVDNWIVCRFSADVLNKLSAGDILLTAEMGCIGSSLAEIREIMALCLRKNIRLIVVADNYVFENSLSAQLLLTTMETVLDIAACLKSQSTRRSLQSLRRGGKALGRPQGSCNKKHKLGGKEDAIREMIAAKLPKTEIARRLGVNRMTLYSFLRQIQQ